MALALLTQQLLDVPTAPAGDRCPPRQPVGTALLDAQDAGEPACDIHIRRHEHGAYAWCPGLCLEPWTYIVPRGSVWHFAAIGDLYGGDGIDDYLVYLASGQVDPYQGLGLTVCK